MIKPNKKEVCGCCTKNVNIGQAITECGKCRALIHTKCFKKSTFKMRNKISYCVKCLEDVIEIYNPFDSIAIGEGTAKVDEDSEKFYDFDLKNISQEFSTISNVLNNCKSVRDIASFNETTGPTENSKNHRFSTLFENIDGNKSNFDEFAILAQQLKHNFSVIGLAETNIDPTNRDLYPLSNYNSFYQEKDPNKSKGSGVALYVHESLTATINTSISSRTNNLESLFVTINPGTSDIHVGVVYNPPSGSRVEFLSEFQLLLARCPKKERTYILGDFNIDLLKLELEQDKQYEEVLLTSGFMPLISIATHFKPGCKESCIDNILTNNPNGILFSGRLEQRVSHHCPIFQFTDISLDTTHKEAVAQHYDFSRSKTEIFLKELVKAAKSHDDEWNFNDFIDIYNCKIDEAFKLDSPKLSKRNRKVNPWITEGIIASVNTKARLYNSWKSTRSHNDPLGNALLYMKYSDFRKSLKHLINAAKAKYYGGKFSSSKGDPKKTWSLINELRGKGKKCIRPQFIINNQRITERRIIANEFNNYFVSLAAKLNDSVGPADTNSPHSSFLSNPSVNSMFLKDCTAEEVEKMILDLENGKASDIPITIIKQSAGIISPILVQVMNQCMRQGIFPDSLKIGKITPIFKKDNPELLENYRPISTLPIFAKIFEKIIYERLYSYFISQRLMTDKQFGFRKGHSTSHALHYSIDHITEATKHKKHVIGIFIDLSKAFDTIDHNILLKKLNHYGVRGNANKLLQSYLGNRVQYTDVLNSKSETAEIMYGVPQGSVLGPLLFLIYINDLINCSTMATFVLFADDTNIFVIGDTHSGTVTRANLVLQAVSRYMKANKLHINSKKSCYMNFTPSMTDQSDRLPISIDKTELTEVKSTKFLGVTIDNKLTWNEHIEVLCKKLRCSVGQLNRIRSYIPEHLYKSIYHSLFESHLNYGITIWGKASKKNINKLFIVQKHCIRILFGDRIAYNDKLKTSARARPLGSQILGASFYKKEHSKPLFNKHSLFTVHNLYKYQTITTTYKTLQTHVPITFHSMFTPSSRKGSLLLMPTYSNTFSYHASSLWNKFCSSTEGSTIRDFSCGIGAVKRIFRKVITERQTLGDSDEWSDANFQL